MAFKIKSFFTKKKLYGLLIFSLLFGLFFLYKSIFLIEKTYHIKKASLPIITVEQILLPPPKGNPNSLEYKIIKRDLTLKKHHGFSVMLQNAGAETRDIAEIYRFLKPNLDFSSLSKGKKFQVHFSQNKQYDISNQKSYPYHISFLSFHSSSGEEFQVKRDKNDQFKLDKKYKTILRVPVFKKGTINHSLFYDAKKEGIPAPIVLQSLKKLGHNVDLSDLKKNDLFEYSYYEYYIKDNMQLIGVSHLHYASLTTKGKKKEIFYITEKSSGDGEWYNEEGVSNKFFLMRTPVDGARISSRYGSRHHPVLKYTKMHRGVDFAAPTGTPIYAAGDGVINKLYRSSSYGKYIKIQHNKTYETAYAHMSRFKSGLRVGSKVKQGQIIGYVGSTGRSTGPHLHYEVIKNGRQINPLSKRIAVKSKPKVSKKKTLYVDLKKDITNRRKNKIQKKEYKKIKDIKEKMILL